MSGVNSLIVWFAGLVAIHPLVIGAFWVLDRLRGLR